MIKILKEIFKFLTSRLFIIMLMFLIYLSLLAGITIYFSYYSLGILIVLEVISIITALIILHRDFNPAYKISFILLVLLLPLVGVVYYYAFGRDKYSKKGAAEYMKWKKFKNFMEEYTLVNEKEYTSIVILGKYLSYSIALGINKKCDSELYKRIEKQYKFNIDLF